MNRLWRGRLKVSAQFGFLAGAGPLEGRDSSLLMGCKQTKRQQATSNQSRSLAHDRNVSVSVKIVSKSSITTTVSDLYH